MDISPGILNGKTCPYCGKRTDFIDSIEIYGTSYGMIYVCIPCDAWVGVHKGTKTALGRLANDELRYWKKEVHKWFDPMWKKKVEQGYSKRKARGKAYKWLAMQMNIPVAFCHVGMFGVEECKSAVKIIQQYYKPINQNSDVKKDE